ncbi:MAG TPA: GMC family oxidoreductase [Gammaproteobacteria bacterium]|nr:GMC family oxidoreductase [Gammaproteobacteria bacterium]
MSVQQVPGCADVIVIGSGFAGAITAEHLVRKGLNVTMLERGPWRDTVPVRSLGITDRAVLPRGRGMFTHTLRSVSSSLIPTGRLRWNIHGLIEVFHGRGLNTICSSSVGGGSHVYSAVLRKPADEAYWDGRAEGLDASQMERHYQRVIERLQLVEPNADMKIPHTAAERMGPDDPLQGPTKAIPTWLGFLFPKTMGEHQKVTTPEGAERWEMNYEDPHNHGFMGSPSGAKTTLDWLLIKPLIDQGMDLRDQTEVMSISQQPAGSPSRYRVDVRDLRSGQEHALYSDHVVVGCGTMNSVRLLLKSRDQDKGLKGMPRLGFHVGGNGDYFAFWDYNDPDRDLSTGLPFHGGFELKTGDETPDDPMVLGGGGWPAVEFWPLPRFIRERLKRTAFTASYGDEAQDGTVTWRGGKLRLNYNPDNSPIYGRIRRTWQKVSRLTGRKIYYLDKPFTIHALGGCCVGRDVSRGVVNGNGEVFDLPGLYVADGSVVPDALGGPPTLTIAAWADHVGEKLAEKLTAG